MARPRNRLLDLLAYLVVRLASCFMEVLPMDWATTVIRWLSQMAYRLNRRYREVALDNLRQAFPGRYTEAELHGMVQQVYEHFGLFLYELTLLPRKLHRMSYGRLMPGFEPVLEAQRTGRPILIVAGHMGNWEMLAYCLAMNGLRIQIVARPLDNPYLERLAQRFRERPGNGVMDKNGSLDRMRQVLASGGNLATLADQDAGPRGLFVNFFGRPASTQKAIAFLARRHRALIVVLGSFRIGGPLHHVLHVGDIIAPEQYAGSADAAFLITQRVTTAMERLICRDPRQYLWLHRRWKNQPSATKAA